MRTLCAAIVAIASACEAQEASRTLSLVEAVALAIENSPALRSAQAELRLAQSSARGARSETLPRLSVNGFATTGNNATVAGSGPGVEPPAWMLVPTGSFLDANLTLMVPFFAGRLREAVTSSDLMVRAAEGELLEARSELALQVILAYDKVLIAKEMVVAEQAKVVATEELVRTTQARVEVGKDIEASVQRTQAELSRASRALTSARNEEAKAVLDLQAAIGIHLAAQVSLTDRLTAPLKTIDLVGQIAVALKTRGALLAARARVEAARSNVRLAESKRLPQLYGFAMGDATDRRDMGGLSVGLTVSIPLFDGGKVSSEVGQGRAMLAKAEAALRQASLDVERDVRQAWLDVLTADANAESARASVLSAESAYNVMALRVGAGKSILLEQLDSLEVLSRARADLAQALYDQAVAAARLARATGVER